MKMKSLIVITAAIGLSGGAHAEPEKTEGSSRKLPPQLLKKFDKDGDGKLNQEEHAAAKEARKEGMSQRKAESLKKFDKDGDGELSKEELADMRETRRNRMIEKFDKDGDGKLSEEERAVARKAAGGLRPKGDHKQGMRKHRPGSGDGGGQLDESDEAPGVTE